MNEVNEKTKISKRSYLKYATIDNWSKSEIDLELLRSKYILSIETDIPTVLPWQVGTV